ncbi:MAG: serine/threonine protein kinase [Elusimicrobia bacterium]|nr:serine/threonine protein kinase [Elusimicrobiota bacterium]
MKPAGLALSALLLCSGAWAQPVDQAKDADKRVSEARAALLKERRQFESAEARLESARRAAAPDAVRDAEVDLLDEKADFAKAAAVYKRAEERYQSLRGGVPFDPELFVVACEAARSAAPAAETGPAEAAPAAAQPSNVDLSALSAPQARAEESAASFDAHSGAGSLAEAPSPPAGAAAQTPSARPRPAATARQGPEPRTVAVGSGAAALLALGLLPFWRRLNLQDVDVLVVGTHRAQRRAAVPDILAEAEKAGLLAGKYELRGVIGRGGMAKVWQAHDRSTGREVAVKKVALPEGPRAEQRRNLALLEARTLTTLRHPNIVDIFEVVDNPAGLFLVFEFLHGKTLQQILAEERTVTLERLSTILRPSCAALEFAHSRGFVHRDFKPSNVMVLTTGAVKVMDFGIARALSEGDQAEDLVGVDPAAAEGRGMQLARTSNLVGTPGYRPPEAEKGIVSTAFDVYSMGAVTYEALVGELPPRPGPGSLERVWLRLKERAPGIPQQAGRAIQAALDPDYTKRPASIQYFRCQALEFKS